MDPRITADVRSSTIAEELGFDLEQFRLDDTNKHPPEARQAAAMMDSLPPQTSGLQTILDTADAPDEPPAVEAPAPAPATEAPPTEAPPQEPAPAPAPVEEPPPVDVAKLSMEELLTTAPETARSYIARAQELARLELETLRSENAAATAAHTAAHAELRERIEAALKEGQQKGWINGGKELLDALADEAPAFQERQAARNRELYEANREAASAGWELLQVRRYDDLRTIAANPAAKEAFKNLLSNREAMRALGGSLHQQMSTALDVVLVRHARPAPAPAPRAAPAPAPAPKPAPAPAPVAKPPAPPPPPPPPRTVPEPPPAGPTSVEEVIALAEKRYAQQRTRR